MNLKSVAATTFAVAAIFAFGACEELDEGTDNNSASQEGDSSGKNGKKKNKGGGPLTVGNWEVQGKIKPKAEEFTGDFTATFRVKNTSDAADSPFFTVNVLKGNNIWASMDCTGGEIKAGQVVTVDCISTDKFKKGWSEVTLENTF